MQIQAGARFWQRAKKGVRLLIKWNAEDAQKAAEQGWGIFETSRPPEDASTVVNGKPYGERPYELQADADSKKFSSDDEAWRFVYQQAANGDALAQKALQFLKENSRAEYKAIARECKPKEATMTDSSKPIQSKNGQLTYAQIDCDDDNWRYAIVTDYEDPQSYGDVIMAFAPEYEPNHETVKRILEAI